MTTQERWQEVMKVLAAALEREPEKRPGYLDQVCRDQSVRREVESLIAAHDQGNSHFLVHSVSDHNVLKTGIKLGSYEIVRLGAPLVLRKNLTPFGKFAGSGMFKAGKAP